MRSVKMASLVMAMCVSLVSTASADTFGTGENQFTIDFVTITANPGVTRSTNTSGDSVETFTAGVGVSDYTDPGNDYRMGTYEITNGQWGKFKTSLDMPVIGDPPYAYNDSPYFTGTDVPTNEVSWYEAAQFVNWLNTSTGHHAAYKFTGMQGTSDYAFDTWSIVEADGGTNLYRHKDAFYYLPTEDEWVKAAYWNGTSLQTWATTHNSSPIAGVDSNYYNSIGQLWDVGSGSEELNGTFDMMGNVWEWTESPWNDSGYGTDPTYSYRAKRAGAYIFNSDRLASSHQGQDSPYNQTNFTGFRVASVPEPATLSILCLSGLALMRRRCTA